MPCNVMLRFMVQVLQDPPLCSSTVEISILCTPSADPVLTRDSEIAWDDPLHEDATCSSAAAAPAPPTTRSRLLPRPRR
jgi:hypothetical protein